MRNVLFPSNHFCLFDVGEQLQESCNFLIFLSLETFMSLLILYKFPCLIYSLSPFLTDYFHSHLPRNRLKNQEQKKSFFVVLSESSHDNIKHIFIKKNPGIYVQC